MCPHRGLSPRLYAPWTSAEAPPDRPSGPVATGCWPAPHRSAVKKKALFKSSGHTKIPPPPPSFERYKGYNTCECAHLYLSICVYRLQLSHNYRDAALCWLLNFRCSEAYLASHYCVCVLVCLLWFASAVTGERRRQGKRENVWMKESERERERERFVLGSHFIL